MYHLNCKKEIFVQIAEVLAVLLTLKCCGRINSIEDNCFSSVLCMWIDKGFWKKSAFEQKCYRKIMWTV